MTSIFPSRFRLPDPHRLKLIGVEDNVGGARLFRRRGGAIAHDQAAGVENTIGVDARVKFKWLSRTTTSPRTADPERLKYWWGLKVGLIS